MEEIIKQNLEASRVTPEEVRMLLEGAAANDTDAMQDAFEQVCETLDWYASAGTYKWVDKHHEDINMVESRMAVAFDLGDRARKALTAAAPWRKLMEKNND